MKFSSLQELFADERRWTKFASGRDAKGFSVGGTGDTATSWCLSGGLTKVYGWGKKREAAALRLREALPTGHPMMSFNDDKTTNIEDIRAVCKAANV